MTYRERRENMMRQMGDGVLILVSPPEVIRNNDAHYDFRPSSDILYLTGFAEPETVVILAPKHEHPFTLFVRARNPEREIWEGRRFGPEGARSEFGADAAYEIEELDDHLDAYLVSGADLYYQLGVDRAFDERVLASMNRLASARRKPNRAPQSIRDPRRILHRMRMVKSAAELELMARAGALTAEAHLAAMRATRPGMNEYELRAIIEGHFLRGGARAPAYGSIVAGGANACCLHYHENRAPLRDGELVLVDAGAELDWYAADITRTWPVGRTFTPAQRAVYQAVLDAEKQSIADCVVGVSNAELQQRTIRRLTEAMVGLEIMKGSVDELIETKAYLKYYMHGVGHYLGLDVHDVGVYFEQEEVGVPMEAGTVLTIEPGIYIPVDDEDVAPEFRGIGVRIEDDVVITHDGPVNLTAGVPKEIDEIEEIRGY